MDFVDQATRSLLVLLLVCLDHFVDEVSRFLDVTLTLLLQLPELVLEEDDLIARLLGIGRRFACQLFHRCEVLGATLVLQLIDSQFNLSGRVLL